MQRRAPRSWSRQLALNAGVAVLLGVATASRLIAAEPALPPPAAEPVDFARDVQPIFARACFECHGPEKQRSSFRLDRRSSALAGGDFGPALISGDSAGSPLVQYVAGLEEGLEMPPKGKRLSAEEIGVLRRWIDDGLIWPDAEAGERDAAETWWSLAPLRAIAPPELTDGERRLARNPIDAFLLARLRNEGIEPAPEADRRTLIRRLTFNLHGLPPEPEEIDRFLADESPDAYEQLVERLLASERYGERWARHWLDVAHYADSHGQDQDRPRPNAWPYRDYVIRALNDDVPYVRFVAEQVAGDVLFPDDPGAIAATGFLAAGPFDESSLVDIREDSIDRLIGQYLDRDDIVTSTMSAFTALTVGCARCHDHKFDPISQSDYYALQAVFAGIDKAERGYDADPAVARRRTELTAELELVRSWRGIAAAPLLTGERQQLAAEYERSLSESLGDWRTLEPASLSAAQGTILKTLIDRSVLAIGPRPEKDTYTIAADPGLRRVAGVRLEVLPDESLPMQGPGRQDNGNLHLSEVRVFIDSNGDGAATATPVPIRFASADFDQEGWGIDRAIDGDAATAWGIYPEVGRPHVAVFEFAEPALLPEGARLRVELDQQHGGGHNLGRFRLAAIDAELPLEARLAPVAAPVAAILATPPGERTDEQRAELARKLWERSLERELAALPDEHKVYCGTNRFIAKGTFRPAATPRPVHVLTRGDVNRPGAEAIPGTIRAVAGEAATFALPRADDEGQRRAALARWLVESDNPLTWRVIVNRVWHYHFGRGLVDTPNDFGRMGSLPSHPELLDWLAATFRDNGGSLKDLHRLIVSSAAYRRTSRFESPAAETDSDNRLLWRMNRARLDGESIRDAVLAVSGRLDLTMYGPAVMHFEMTQGIHVTPDTDYDAFDVDSPAARRRSVYRFVLRTRPDPLMEVLDCPDASQSTPVRSTSVSALQALALWNDKFTLRYAERLAERAASESDSTDARLSWLALRVFGRDLEPEERAAWSAYADEHGLANLSRVLLNSSEFLFVE
ncbi:MAG: PSD1 domain-containing protein [Planctomyces sp.]|nr:PSD1 domain-containing protein [Planctomyces sp.]